jgi:hypothetical protein
MPTLFRFILVLGTLAALGYGAMWSLATFVTPDQREITVMVPASRFVK